MTAFLQVNRIGAELSEAVTALDANAGSIERLIDQLQGETHYDNEPLPPTFIR